MMSVCGYNFSNDQDAMNPMATNLNNINCNQISNAIYDKYTMTHDTNACSSDKDTVWDFLTILDANFNGTINAGNVDFTLDQVDSIRIKRRIVGDFDWIWFAEIPINTIEDLKFYLADFLNAGETKYEYAFVPTLQGIEGNYITNSIFSKLDGVFICDKETIIRFYAGVGFHGSQVVRKTGVFEPIGRKYPVVVCNGKTNYRSGGITGTILPSDYETTREINRKAIVDATKLVEEFLTDGNAKIIKDYNGNIYLAMIVNNLSLNYRNEYSMGMVDVSANFVEQGDANKQKDLFQNNLVDYLE